MSEPIVFISHFIFIELTRRELYGLPGEQAQAMSQSPGGSGIKFNHLPQFMGGYIRLKPV